MEGQGVTELQDWEEVQVNSDSDHVSSPKPVGDSASFEAIEADSGGLIRLDHFSLEKEGVLGKNIGDGSEDGSGVESDNPSWIDPRLESAQFPRRDLGEFWSDSGSDRSDDRRFDDFEVKNELGSVEKVKGQVGFEGVGGKVESFREFGRKGEMGCEESLHRQVGLEGFDGRSEKGDVLSKIWSGSGGEALVLGDVSNVSEELGDGERGNVSEEENSVVAVAGEERKQGGEEKRNVAWWKVPFEMIKYCVLRVGPVWSFSMAAAVVGFIMLGWRLYKMKRKAQGLQLKVAVDDKKVSQVMSRAARLNEAFSVVRRVPIVRPLLPPTGVNPWPVMSLR